jgi:hypothetical protein
MTTIWSSASRYTKEVSATGEITTAGFMAAMVSASAR